MGRPDPCYKKTGPKHTGGRSPGLKRREHRKKKVKEKLKHIICEEKKEERVRSANDLLGLLDDLLHNFLHHGIALVVDVDGSILGELGGVDILGVTEGLLLLA